MAFVNIDRLGLQIGRIDVSTSKVQNVVNWARRCPLCLNGTLEINGVNTSLFVVGEDQSVFQSITDEHVRKIDGVRGVKFTPIVRWTRGFSARLDLSTERTDDPPCNMMPYCEWCPRNPMYVGDVWRRSKQ